jgi:hypothetical protein
MNKSNVFWGVLGLAVVGIVAYSSGVLAFQGNGQAGPNYTPERHTAMEKAFENNDYAAWKNLMGDKGATRVVTQENFAKFSEMHKLMVAGKTDEANAIRTELGLGQGNGKGHRGQNQRGNFVDANGDGKCDNLK